MTRDQQAATRDAVVDGLLGAVLARYGSRLDATGQAKVRDDLEKLVDSAEALRAYPLTNGDEPDFIFNPLRQEG